MKEEIIKLLESVELKNEEGNENYSNYADIKNDFEYAINKVKESDEDLELYEKIKEKVNTLNAQETEFRKFRIAKSLSKDIIAVL
ncbi:MAG: hypothetical protein J6A89_04210 [Clostridia bacterium]|nr:hypothetical protein [Clostridia bacterium]